ncbi:flagellar motor protein MotB [Marinobacterium sediminicola]|uniref:Chemotaxis protein MotB n=1 Tax=Marinobacterium sediminicola TaxID=518898 RepID=A0ABY1RYD1_9GAMM|nr:flagellar motor protein MotB [Marinobacterium sediminicola]ULG68705.1 OmpA family protein [Marinobacterium sediminicola]SMR73230.1 chemotaxis protein MotB [Marinobacterium sediminicola]
MNSRRRELTDESGTPGWLMTYADLMTLLLVFFVLLFSMSNLEKERFVEAMRSFQTAFQRAVSGAPNNLIPLEHNAPGNPSEEINEAIVESPSKANSKDEGEESAEDRRARALKLDWERLNRDLDDAFEQMQMQDAIEIGTPKDGKLSLRVKGGLLFNSGSATFNYAMLPMLDALLDTLAQNPDYKLEIQGHTDDIPISTPQFPSNWELSAVRATTVLRYMVDAGINPKRLTATGYGSSLPLVPNTSTENRAINRRIEFVLEKRALD